MAIMRKILKNRTGSELVIVGVIVADNEDFEIPIHQWAKLAEATDIHDFITAGTIIVNNGTIDFSIANGLRWAKLLATDLATEIVVDNINQYSTNVQDALFEQVTLNKPNISFNVKADTTRIHPNLHILDSTEVDIEDDGELLVI